MFACCKFFNISTSSRNLCLSFLLSHSLSSHQATSIPVTVSSPLYTVLNDPRPTSSNLRYRPSGLRVGWLSGDSELLSFPPCVDDRVVVVVVVVTVVTVVVTEITVELGLAGEGDEECSLSTDCGGVKEGTGAVTTAEVIDEVVKVDAAAPTERLLLFESIPFEL